MKGLLSMTKADSVLSTPPLNTSVEPLYLPIDMTPEEIFRAIGKLRMDARDEIDRLIRFLDKTDDYVSRELEQEDGNDEPEGHEEPSLGACPGNGLGIKRSEF
jgi:bacterioferritin (cytochrome b1)